MSFNPISLNGAGRLSTNAASGAAGMSGAGATPGFSSILSEAFEAAGMAEQADKSSSLALLSGQAEDMAGLLIDSQKAEIALSLALSLRSKVLESYNEIMRMQV